MLVIVPQEQGETPYASAELVIVQPIGQRREQELIHWQSGPCGVTKKQKQKQNVSGTIRKVFGNADVISIFFYCVHVQDRFWRF